jgi:LPS export ABC transporter protein LptC
MSRCVGFTVGCALIVAVACQDQGATPPVTGKASPDTADQTLFGIRLVLSDHGVQRALLQADTAFTFEDNTRTELRVVRSTFYTETGVKDATLTSRQGTYNSRSGNMEARGNVVVIAEDGRRLETPQLRYDPGRNEISGDSAFVLTRPEDVLEGIGFVTDPNLTRIRVIRAARGRTTKSVAQPDR